MSIDDYIESLANFDKDRRAYKVTLSDSTALPSQNLFSLPETERSTFHLEFEDSLYNKPRQLDLTSSAENKHKTTYGQSISLENASVKPRTTKAIKLESYRFNNLKRHFKEFNEQYIEVVTEHSSNKSDGSFITVSSEKDSSYFTAVEDFVYLEKISDNLKSEISFDSGIDAGKRDLITRLLHSKGEDFLSEEERLLQSKGEDFLSEEEFLIDCPTNLHDIVDLLDDIETEQRDWNEDISEQIMYKDRIQRFFQTPDSHDPTQKEISVIKSSRKYFMNLSDEDFSGFEIKKSSLGDEEL